MFLVYHAHNEYLRARFDEDAARAAESARLLWSTLTQLNLTKASIYGPQFYTRFVPLHRPETARGTTPVILAALGDELSDLRTRNRTPSETCIAAWLAILLRSAHAPTLFLEAMSIDRLREHELQLLTMCRSLFAIGHAAAVGQWLPSDFRSLVKPMVEPYQRSKERGDTMLTTMDEELAHGCAWISDPRAFVDALRVVGRHADADRLRDWQTLEGVDFPAP